ncbi:MAG: SAM-dependent chlorinase/fluorinase [Acidobacteria bacterium]|nr:SAM-dependent chlorinase/fluorinase [Acidobacteriota bacterium]
MAIVTLLSDFGLRDHFVASMKGVMLGLNPELTFVDISHEIPPQDVFSAAFTLGQTWHLYPPGTVHLAVVDPGVGGARKALAASAGGQFFVAPDNGILSYVFSSAEDSAAYEITAEHYYRKPVSATFQGRDIFAPIAAWISRGIPLPQLGPALPDPVKLQLPAIKRVQDALIQGVVLAVDHFGNLVTNLRPEDVPRAFRIMAGKQEIIRRCATYGEGAAGEFFIVAGSTGYLEIAVKNGSAAERLNMKPGFPIGVILE